MVYMNDKPLEKIVMISERYKMSSWNHVITLKSVECLLPRLGTCFHEISVKLSSFPIKTRKLLKAFHEHSGSLRGYFRWSFRHCISGRKVKTGMTPCEINLLINPKRNEGMIDHRSYAHNSSSCEIKAWKNLRSSNIWSFMIWIRTSPPGFHPTISPRGFLSRHARRTKRKRDYS